MATRSTITIINNEGKFETIYCHNDGYIEWNGKILNENYNTIEKAQELVDLGQISSLYPKIKPEGEHSFESPEEGVTVAYGRDRGETGVEKDVSDSFRDCQKGEYNYLFVNGAWVVESEYGKSGIVSELLTED